MRMTELCEKFENDGADEVYIFEISSTDEEHETNIGIIKEIVVVLEADQVVNRVSPFPLGHTF